jgi:hypothetical protein
MALSVEAGEHGLIKLAVVNLGLVLGDVNAAVRWVLAAVALGVPQSAQAHVVAVVLVRDEAALVFEPGRLAFALRAVCLFGHRCISVFKGKANWEAVNWSGGFCGVGLGVGRQGRDAGLVQIDMDVDGEIGSCRPGVAGL